MVYIKGRLVGVFSFCALAILAISMLTLRVLTNNIVVSISNHLNERLLEIYVTMGHARLVTGTLDPGQSSKHRVKLDRESGVNIQYKDSTGTHMCTPDVYLTSNDTGAIEITFDEQAVRYIHRMTLFDAERVAEKVFRR